MVRKISIFDSSDYWSCISIESQILDFHGKTILHKTDIDDRTKEKKKKKKILKKHQQFIRIHEEN